MEFRILGSLEVVAGDRVEAPTRGKQRTLLAYLLLHANERLSIDRLIDALWGERPPPTAAASLHNNVARLRRALDADRIETAGSTYLLRLAPGELDAHRFEDLVRDGEQASPAEGAEILRSALSLWRGHALADVEDELFAQPEIARLEELRLTAIEQRIAAELELGESRTLVAELEALAREHPLREGVRAKLMLALYRAGRQADALDVYQQARRLLVDELGIEPSQSLQQVHRQILLQDAALGLEPAGVAEAAPAGPAPAPAREVRKSVTVALLSVDVQVSDPEIHRDLGERCEALVRAAVERHGGSLQAGAAIAGLLAVFGVPELHEDDALRAVRAVTEARTALADLDADLGLRAGVATGEMIAGAALAGRPLQDARELERRAARGEILLMPATQRLVRDAVECEPDGQGALRLVRLDPRAPGVARRLDAPLVARERELLLLETSFAHAARTATCHLFTVCGEGGIGKSRLVAELMRSLGDAATILAGQCLPYGEGITYWPVVEIVRAAAGIGDDDPAAARERIAALVPGPDGEAVADRLTGLLGRGDPVRADEIAWALRRLLEALAATRPVVVAVDDLHLAEPTLLDLLEGLAERSHDAPILLVGLARQELLEIRPAWGGGMANATTVSLDALDEHESGLLLDNLPGGSELEPALRSRVIAAAGGHPLFVEELLTMLAEAGRTIGGDDGIALPVTVQALLATRLERLSDAERLVLECGAIEGETFHAGALDRVAPELEPEAREEALAGLVRVDLIRPVEAQFAGGPAFRFRHALVREQAYAALLRERRATLHSAFGSWLGEVGASRLAELEEILAFHFEQAFRLWSELGAVDDERRALGERAGRLLAGAGRRAYERSDLPAATSLLGRAAGLLPPDDEERLRLLIDLGDALRARGDFERAAAVLVEARTRAAATGRSAIEAHAELERLLVRTTTDSASGIDELVRAATAIADDPDAGQDLVARAKALHLLGIWHWNALDSGRAAEYLVRARKTAEQAEAPTVRRQAQLGLALTFLTGPMPVPDALAAIGALLEAARGDRRAEAMLLTYAGALESLRGRFDEARSLLARGAQQLDDLGHRVLRAAGDFAPLAELIAGDAVSAERIARSALETLTAVGERANAALVAWALAEALHRQGRDGEAEEQLAFAARVEPEALLIHARVDATRARVLARRGETAAAVELARKTIALLESTDALVLRGDAQRTLSEALRAAGRLDEADAAASEAEALYDAKGASALAAAVAVGV